MKKTLKVLTSLDAPIVVIGQRKMLNYSTELPDLKEGVHFCLFNNLRGTNFSQPTEHPSKNRNRVVPTNLRPE